MRAIVDIEANGLLDTITDIWCIVVKNIDTEDIYIYVPDSYINETKHCEGIIKPLSAFAADSENIEEWIGHNFINYDSRAIEKILGIKIPLRKITDTLILSQMRQPVRSGGHGLAAWGRDLGDAKGTFDEFDKFSWAMVKYCIQDVQVNHKVYSTLQKSIAFFSKRSIRLEHYMRKVLDEMQTNGFKLDKPRAHAMLGEITQVCDKMREAIRVDFPPIRRYLSIRQIRTKKDGTLHTASERFLNNNLYVDYKDAPDTFKELVDEALVTKNTELEDTHLAKTLFVNDIEIKDGDKPQLLTTDNFKVEYIMEEFNLSSPKQVVQRMEEAGWQPVVFKKPSKTQKDKGMTRGSPQLCEENFETLPPNAPQSALNIALYLTLISRVRVLEQWFDVIDEETDLVHGSVISIGANTHRMAHRGPNMANNPKVKTDGDDNIIYGKDVNYASDFRACWIPRADDRVICGVDLSGIQLRGFAHYANSKDYIKQILTGDIHTFNLGILQKLVSQYCKLNSLDEITLTRGNAKTFIYAFLFGAGNQKVGTICKFSAKHQMNAGKFIKEGFVKSIDGLEEFKQEIKRSCRKGYMIALDGRLIQLPSEHLALSIYLQSFESIIMKYAIRLVRQKISARNIDALLVAIVHDETQWDVKKEHAEELGKLMVESMEEAGRYFKCNMPITGEYKIGNNWAESH